MLGEPTTDLDIDIDTLERIEEFLKACIELEYLRKLGSYGEELNRDVRYANESPAIGVLLCASTDVEVVDYVLSRESSPALTAESQKQFPDKALLQATLHEFWVVGERSDG